MSSAAPRKMRDRRSAFYDRSAQVMQLTAIRIHIQMVKRARQTENVRTTFRVHFDRPELPQASTSVVLVLAPAPLPAPSLAPPRPLQGEVVDAAARPQPVDQGGRDPAETDHECEGLVGRPRAAVVAAAAEANVAPVEGVAAGAVDPVNQQSEGAKPADREPDVGFPAGVFVVEGEDPEQGPEDGEPGDDLGEDESGQSPARLPSVGLQVVSGYTGDDGRED